MEPNQVTVSSMADLIVMDENEDKTTLSTQTTANSAARKVTSQVSQTSESDSVFGEVSLDDHAVRFELAEPGMNGKRADTPTLQRQGSLRSQLSVSSSHKEPVKRELKLKTFVSFLFIVIVTGVSVVLHFAKNREYEVELGKKIIVHEDTRKIEFEDQARNQVVLGLFGLGIPEIMLPYDCSDDKLRQSHLCLRWRGFAQLNIDYWEGSSSKCYDIGWRSLNKDSPLKDCFELDLSSTRWYGGWINGQQSWPLGNISIPLQPYVTSQMHSTASFGPVLERYWLSSKGVSIFSTDLMTPLHVSWNAAGGRSNVSEGDGKFCLVSGYNHPLNRPQPDQETFLNYTVCVSDNIIDVHHLSLQRISADRNLSLTEAPDMSLFHAPVWALGKSMLNIMNETSIQGLGLQLAQLELPVGLLLLENEWQQYEGNLDFDLQRFSNVTSMVESLKAHLNCSVALGVSPYISVHSTNFASFASKGMLVKDAGGLAPGLFHWKDSPYSPQSQLVGALDFTSSSVVSWFEQKLSALRQETSVEVYSYHGGEATVLPFEAVLGENRTNRNLFTYDYGVTAWDISQPAIMDSATHLQAHPVVVRLAIHDITQVIPSVLNAGILGYPYSLPVLTTPRMSKDLYIRWVQLSAFLPIMHLATPPDENGPEVVRHVQQMIAVHQNLTHPLVMEIAQGETPMDPVIRPLWWLFPTDPVAIGTDSQFLVGDELLVAPVLEEGTVQRDVYLPDGTWYSKNRTEYTGPLWLRNHSVPLYDFVYFTLK